MFGPRISSAQHTLRTIAIAVLITLVAVACGGDADDSTVESSEQPAASAEPTAPRPTATQLAVVTSTPLPSPTPLPTSTPAPLEAPTASAVLLSTAFTNSSKVTTVGIDEVFFGMTPEDAAEAASTEWVQIPSSSGTCYRVTPAKGPEGITLWVVDGHIERLDIEHPDLRTPSQLGLGNTEAELQSQLGGRLTVEDADDGRRVATFAPTDPGDRDFRIIFELVDDQVVRYRSGRIGIVQRAPEGC